MKVKICGITNIEDALLCEKFGADALGFIFHDKSKRFVSAELASEIIKQLSPFTLKVGVFVNETSETINLVSETVGLNIVQMHGDETPEQIDEINLPVIKSFRISKDFNFNILGNYKNCHFLFDTYSSEQYGGTGNTFDWNLIPKHITDKIILSGGISSPNIKTIITNIKPYAIDVSSSLEESPGKKSDKKLKEFFYNIKGTK